MSTARVTGYGNGLLELKGDGGISMLDTVTMNNNKITDLAAGTISSSSQDAVNGSQLYGLAQSTASALGGGSSVDASGAITAPSFPLTNANSINGTSGAATNIGSAFSAVDTALGKLNTSVTTLNNAVNGGGIKYFHANSTLADSRAAGTDSIAVGGNAFAETTGAIAIGANSDVYSSAPGGVAIGSAAKVTNNATNSVALGANSIADRANAVSVGSSTAQRQIEYVAAGAVNATSTDAINGSQLFGTNQNVSNLSNTVNNLGGNVSNINNQVTNIVNGGGIKYFHANSTGADSSATGADAVAIGTGATAAAAGSIAIGRNAKTSGASLGSAVAIGDGAVANNVSAAVGYGAQASGDNSLAMGRNAVASMSSSAALGYGASASGAEATALGYGAWATATQATALGKSAYASAADATAVGTGAQASGMNSVALGYGASSTAANSIALGSGSTTTANLSAAGYNPGTGTLSGTASVANGEVSVGSAGKERRVTNVAAGYAATDAVNVSQLMSEDAKVNNVSNNLSNLSNTVNNINTATALTMIPDVDQGKTIAVGIGAGSYHGYQATALGASARITQNIKVKIGAGISGQGTTVGVGGSYQW